MFITFVVLQLFDNTIASNGSAVLISISSISFSNINLRNNKHIVTKKTETKEEKGKVIHISTYSLKITSPNYT